MTLPAHSRETGVVLDERDERARAAVKAFRAMQPTLSGFARVITRNPKVRVDLVSNGQSAGSTDGERIFYRPPIELGDKHTHVRVDCDRRDETGLLKCPACAIREEVLVTIYHEISHICYDSFAPASPSAIEDAIKAAVAEHGTKYAKRIDAAIRGMSSHNYVYLSNAISPYMFLIQNAFEDARIESRLFDARKGTKVMFQANVAKIFREGVEQNDHTIKYWREYPLNTQACFVMYLMAAGYPYRDHVHEKIVADLADDPVLNDLGMQVRTARSVSTTYALAFKALARLRELGYCKSDKDPEDEPEEEPKDEDAGSSGDDSSDANDESGADDGDDPDGESDSSGGDSDSDDPESDDGEDSESSDKSDSDGGDDSSDDGDGSDGSDDSESSPGEGGSAEPTDPGAGEGDDVDEPDAGSDSSGDDGTDSDTSMEGTVDESADNQADGFDSGEAGSDTDGPDGPSSGQRSAGLPHADYDDKSEGSDAEDHADPAHEGSEAGRDSEGHDDTSDDEEPIDTGADDGEGGTMVKGETPTPPPDYGNEDDAKAAILKWLDHEEKPHSIERDQDESAVDKAIIQGIYFESPSVNVFGVREHRWGFPIESSAGYNYSRAWSTGGSMGHSGRATGRDSDLHVPESLIGSALLKMRVAFSNNARGRKLTNLKDGKVNTRTLAKRAPFDDDRLFKRNVAPGKRSYFVVIMMDVSGSTLGRNLAIEKHAVMAQAELLKRMGIPFAIYAESGNYHDAHSRRNEGLDLDIYLIKEPHEPWAPATMERLEALGPDAANLDGHAMEYARKALDKSNATDKIILYYSDGKMPAENFHEELEILQREIRICKQKRYVLLGVGIRTDSPAKHGLETVQLDSVEDTPKVVDQLGKHILRNAR